jgi:hypothetical protein
MPDTGPSLHGAWPRAANLPDRELLISLFETMVLLRRFELAAQVACRAGETPASSISTLARRRPAPASVPTSGPATG